GTSHGPTVPGPAEIIVARLNRQRLVVNDVQFTGFVQDDVVGAEIHIRKGPCAVPGSIRTGNLRGLAGHASVECRQLDERIESTSDGCPQRLDRARRWRWAAYGQRLTMCPALQGAASA